MSEKTEIKKAYHRQRDKSVIKIRVNAAEKTLLDIAMKDEDWENVSGFIKYRLFGFEPDEAVRKIIKEKDKGKTEILLYNELKELNANLAFFKFRYDKDMRQLFREEGVNVEAWIKATRRTFLMAERSMKDILTYCKEIAQELKIDIEPSFDEKEIITDIGNTEKMDETSEKMFRKTPALNYDDVAPKYI